MKPAPGFDLAHLVALAFWPIVDDEFATQAEPIALLINQLERDTVCPGIVIRIDLEWTV